MVSPTYFESASDKFYGTYEEFNPIVVSSEQEFENLLDDLSFVMPLSVKTLHLPPGVDICDPRIKTAKTVSARCYTAYDNRFLYPDLCYFADIDKSIKCIEDIPYQGSTTRIQVVPATQIPIAEELGNFVDYGDEEASNEYEENTDSARQSVKTQRGEKSCCC